MNELYFSLAMVDESPTMVCIVHINDIQPPTN